MHSYFFFQKDARGIFCYPWNKFSVTKKTENVIPELFKSTTNNCIRLITSTMMTHTKNRRINGHLETTEVGTVAPGQSQSL